MFHHTPVLLKEVIDGLDIKKDGTYLDLTIGGAGHSSEILKRLDKGWLIGFDQDRTAIEASRKRLEAISPNFTLVKSNYYQAADYLAQEEIQVDGILMDLGVSSYQLDTAERGFSYSVDAPLDMRMDEDQSFSAYDVINGYSKDQLSKIFWDYGEEKWADRVAEFIIKERKKEPIQTSFELVDLIKAAIPRGARQKGGHPAKRVFQAVRIEVNQELKVLEESIGDLVGSMKKGGRIAIISFHSLEDRIVKNAFKYEEKSCICPPDLPVCMCDKEKRLKILTRKPITASNQEKEENPRAKSAKLRIAERL